MLVRGYIVTVADYAGLGTPSLRPDLVGVSAGRAVLDVVKAAAAWHAFIARIVGRFAGKASGGDTRPLRNPAVRRHVLPETQL